MTPRSRSGQISTEVLSDRQAEVVVCADVHLPLLQAAGLSPVKLLLCLRSSDVWVRAHALRVLWRCARFPPLFPWARVFEHRPRALIGSRYLREEKGSSSRSRCVCMKKKNRRNRELRQPNFRVRRRINRWAVCRGWRKLSRWLRVRHLWACQTVTAQTCDKIASESD